MPGNDWIVVKLAARGEIDRVVVDTAHFKGNYPDACSLQAADLGAAACDVAASVTASSMFWREVLPPQKLQADSIHTYEAHDLAAVGPVTFVRFNIFPDGGISRLRIYGTVAAT